jgi:c-di-AMP phosphodiesterase-like protein
VRKNHPCAEYEEEKLFVVFCEITFKERIGHEGKEKKSDFKNIKLKNRYYDIYTSIIDTSEIKNKEDNIVLLYFYDVTEMVKLENSIEENKPSVMLVEVDNLDEVIKSIEEDKRPILNAEIERAINNYAQA